MMHQDTLKGLLILLVIFDHNEYAHQQFPGFLEGFSFHVMGFFALPFLRPVEVLGRKQLQELFFRVFYPFSWIVCGMALLTLLMRGDFSMAWLGNLALALYSGNSAVLKTVTQMSMLWFLPTFLSLMLIRGLVFPYHWVKAGLLAIAVILHPLIGTYATEVRDYLPFGLLPALYALPLIVVIVALQQSVFDKYSDLKAIAIVAAGFLVAKFFQVKLGASQELGFAEVATYRELPKLIFNDLEAVLGSLLMFQLARLNLGPLIEKCGKNSMQVYLIHGYIALGIYKLSQKSFAALPALWLLLISLSFTALLSWLIAQRIMLTPIARRFLFPKSWKELRRR